MSASRGVWDAARRVLLVHAHPDDETLATGALIAGLRDRGVEVGVLTCTRGERGEVVTGVLDGSVSGADLSQVREAELSGALAVLGVQWCAYLGQPPASAEGTPARRYVDSGMEWVRPGLAGPANDVAPHALTQAELDDVCADLGAAIADFGPDIIVTYDDDGGYGHPDHLRCFEAVGTVARQVGLPFFATTTLERADWIDDGSAWLAVVAGALQSHRTQLTVYGDEIVHSGGQREAILLATGLRRVS